MPVKAEVLTPNASQSAGLRPDLAAIVDWIEPGSHLLDLGCGDGALLAYLQREKGITGYGVEIGINKVTECIARGINVIHADIEAGLGEFTDNSFDYVVMNQTLQATHFPRDLLREMLRIGKQGIVTLPNFGHWRCRVQLGLFGRMPVSSALPAAWYETQNLHLCSLSDFDQLCTDSNLKVLERQVLNHNHSSGGVGAKLFPNLFGEVALYRVARQ
ncbi:MAG: methionine biosynthesis protein MetW [Gammaproteobacteria bacterium]|nr:MAG: methionine biosynthesis protein MetW [Gammaproteobacteria bacterium]RLA17944.1 MAG: methionine biosynthesis protein MetW [Gammaproteobacteria bacterium]